MIYLIILAILGAAAYIEFKLHKTQIEQELNDLEQVAKTDLANLEAELKAKLAALESKLPKA